MIHRYFAGEEGLGVISDRERQWKGLACPAEGGWIRFARDKSGEVACPDC